MINKQIEAGLAQLVEQLFCKQQVIGSIPVASSILPIKFGIFALFDSIVVSW